MTSAVKSTGCQSSTSVSIAETFEQHIATCAKSTTPPQTTGCGMHGTGHKADHKASHRNKRSHGNDRTSGQCGGDHGAHGRGRRTESRHGGDNTSSHGCGADHSSTRHGERHGSRGGYADIRPVRSGHHGGSSRSQNAKAIRMPAPSAPDYGCTPQTRRASGDGTRSFERHGWSNGSSSQQSWFGSDRGQGGSSGGCGSDRYASSRGNDTIYGGSGNDVINGGYGNDTIYGGYGNDRINGGSGNDTIYGGPGNDRINGGSGNDTIYGGRGNDVINGGPGYDTVVYGRSRDHYSVSSRGTTTTVSDGRERDTLRNAENIRFGGDRKTASRETQSNWSVGAVKDGKSTIKLGDRYSIALNEKNATWTLTDNCNKGSTKISGDPHVDIGNNGSTDFDFKKNASFQLEDGTKITVGTTPYGAAATMSSKLTITKGNNAIVVSGLADVKDGANNLAVRQSHNGRALDASTPDGAFTLKQAGKGWTLDGKAPTQAAVNAKEAKSA